VRGEIRGRDDNRFDVIRSPLLSSSEAFQAKAGVSFDVLLGESQASTARKFSRVANPSNDEP